MAQNRNALRLLIGGELPDRLTKAQQLTQIELEFPKPADLDSSLLLRRPDIQRAEHELRAANARIGAARAAFFPRISLSSEVGSISADMDGLFGDNTGIWRFTPRIEIPIFDAGRREAQLEVAEVRKRQEIAQYEGAIQQAFREVADALVANTALQNELKARRDQVRASEATAEQARARFKSGAASFLPVLDAQRELFEARQAAIGARQELLVSRISLYRALGGGWSVSDTASHTASKAKEISSE